MSSFDVFFISYSESNASQNWHHLNSIVSSAHRIHGVKGIGQAQILASKMAQTEHFFTVDGDNWIYPGPYWNRPEGLKEHGNKVHVWRCYNPVNDLVYGHGGVKLWPTKLLLSKAGAWKKGIDFTSDMGQLLGGYHIQKEVASETRFNASPLEAWRGAYRECAKLACGGIKNAPKQSQDRLKSWMATGQETPFGHYALAGAKEGCRFGQNNPLSEVIGKINNFAFLEELFNSRPHV